MTSETNNVFNLTMARWCFELFGEKWSLEKHCQVAQKLNCTAIDLAPVQDWPTIFDHDLKVTCGLPDMGADIPPFGPGFCNPDRVVRQQVRQAIKGMIDSASSNDVPYVIVFTGMEIQDVSSDQALSNCVAADGFPDVVRYAHQRRVGLVLESLNTAEDSETWRGHPGYYGNTFDFIARVVQQTNSALDQPGPGKRLGFVFDPYHQSMNGDNCFTIIERHHELIDVVHLAGFMQDPPSPKNRCEIHLPGQRIDYGSIAQHLARKGKQDLPVMCEWIPQLDDAEEGVKQAAELFSD